MTTQNSSKNRTLWIVGNLVSSIFMGAIAWWLFARASSVFGYIVASIFVMGSLIAFINAFVNPARARTENGNGKPSAATMLHPSLGKLRFDGEGIWICDFVFNRRRLEVAIGGSVKGPNQKLAEQALTRLSAVEKTQEEAIAFMKSQFASVTGFDVRDFEIDSLDFIWPDSPDSFVVQFRSQKDPEGIWKVEFVDSKPKHLSRDD